MSDVALSKIGDNQVPITGLDPSKVLEESKFRAWLGSQIPGFDYPYVDVLANTYLPNGRLLFSMICYRCEAVGFKIYGTIAGRAAAILVILEDENGVPYTLLAEQFRPLIGQRRAIELLAGRITAEEGFAGRAASVIEAAREASEESGLRIVPGSIIPLGFVYSSHGLTDEIVEVYYTEPIRMTREEILRLEGITSGLPNEYEDITLHVVPLADLLSASELQDNGWVINSALHDPKLIKALHEYRNR